MFQKEKKNVTGMAFPSPSEGFCSLHPKCRLYVHIISPSQWSLLPAEVAIKFDLDKSGNSLVCSFNLLHIPSPNQSQRPKTRPHGELCPGSCNSSIAHHCHASTNLRPVTKHLARSSLWKDLWRLTVQARGPF